MFFALKKQQNDITEDNFNRLASSIMEHRLCSYEEALSILNSLKVHFIVSSELADSIPLQAALFTAINTGVRCFLGGVTVEMPKEKIKSLIPWPGETSLEKIVLQLGASLVNQINTDTPTLFFGNGINGTSQQFKVVCNNWQAGIIKADQESKIKSTGNIPLGGIAAGSLGIAVLFFQTTTIHSPIQDYENGISLWRPDIHWLDKDAYGPFVTSLPKKYWILGLGHLGQAYLWAIGLLSFKNPAGVNIFLQDNDKMTVANITAGLLCDSKSVGKYKTRICSAWLEERGFSTAICERYYDGSVFRREEEPFLALCGFDNAAARSFLENSGFRTIVECGLGGKLSDFDKISLHTFPSSIKKPSELWHSDQDKRKILNLSVKQDFEKKNKSPCGILAENLASKSISTSFVGAFAASLTIAEVVRAVNGGRRIDTIAIQLRSLIYKKVFLHSNPSFLQDLALNGFSEVE